VELQGILTDPRDLELARELIHGGDPRLIAAWKHVLRKAEKCLALQPLSVTQNTRVPPSGDKHDYSSCAAQWWPNPATPDGLPYVRRDGEINPEFVDSDAGRVRHLCDAVQHLGLATAISGEVQFAEKAAALVRHWFIAPATRMNPHLSYAQRVPGVRDGRSDGIMDFKPLRELLDALSLLPPSAWTEADRQAVSSWMRAYLDWLTTSPFGLKESARPNNLGTWYDTQALAVALFVGDDQVAHTVCRRAKERIAQQLTPTGAQPAELARSQPLSHCMANLQAFFDLASMAERCGEDLWAFDAGDGRSLRKAAEWLLPLGLGERSYEGDDITKAAPQRYLSVFRRAAIKFDDERFERAVERFFPNTHKPASAHLLQFPKPSPRPWPTVSASSPECNLCGGKAFESWKSRPNSLCSTCHSQERTRVLKLYLDRLDLGPESKILHIAPERSLSAFLAKKVGSGGGYDAVDLTPERYEFANARKLDLVADAEALPSAHYDLILHVHVMEHLPCDVTAVLFHLHRALKPTGLHLCSIPILKGRYASDFARMSSERAVREFGHKEHVRRFGAADIHKTLGMVFNLPKEYNLETQFEVPVLKRFNVPKYARRGWSAHTVLAFRKDDLKLRA
jgi:predicted SAM-dependent methyltransferase